MRSQMRNIAPFLTLIFLSALLRHRGAPPSPPVDNLGNILTQVSVTGNHRRRPHLREPCGAESLICPIASIANVTGIAGRLFHAAGILRQYRQFSDARLAAAILIGAGTVRVAWPRQCTGADDHRHPLLHHDARHDADQRPAFSALLVRGQIAYKVPPLITTLGSGSIGGDSLDRDRRRR